MDFGGFICFGFQIVVLVGGIAVVGGMWLTKSPQRWLGLKFLGAFALLVILSGGWLVKVYVLDEGLVIAASDGDSAKVKWLLSWGANPEARWEDGTTAMQNAETGGHPEIVQILKQAGAKQ